MEDTGQHLAPREVMKVVCDSLRELRDAEGVTPTRVRQFVQQKYGNKLASSVTERSLRLELHKGVQEGFLVRKGGRYNISNINSTQKQADNRTLSTKPNTSSKSELSSKSSDITGSIESESCGCPSKRKRSSSRKSRGCKRRSSKRRKSSKGKMVCKKVCKRVGGKRSQGLIKRLMSLLTGGGGKKGGCNKMRKKNKKFSWVKSHCRKNALRRRKKRKC